MTVVVKVDSPAKLAALLRGASIDMYREIAEDLLAPAARLEREIKSKTPVDTGLLRASNTVVVTYTNRSVSFTAYNNMVYAAVQHEKEFKHDPPGQSKYIEEPFNVALPEIKKQIAETLERLLTDV